LLHGLREHIQHKFPKNKKEALADVRAYRAPFIQRRRDIIACGEIYMEHYDPVLTKKKKSQPKVLYDALSASCIVESGEQFSSLVGMGQDIFINRLPAIMKAQETEDENMQRGLVAPLEVLRAGYHGLAEAVVSYIHACGGDMYDVGDVVGQEPPVPKSPQRHPDDSDNSMIQRDSGRAWSRKERKQYRAALGNPRA
jgi:hypothetical protein